MENEKTTSLLETKAGSFFDQLAYEFPTAGKIFALDDGSGDPLLHFAGSLMNLATACARVLGKYVGGFVKVEQPQLDNLPITAQEVMFRLMAHFALQAALEENDTDPGATIKGMKCFGESLVRQADKILDKDTESDHVCKD